MSAIWTLVVLGSAGIAAYLTYRSWFRALPTPANILSGGILFLVFVLAPVHLAASLDVVGLPVAVRVSTIAWIAVLLLLAVIGMWRSAPAFSVRSTGPGDTAVGIDDLPFYLRVAIAISLAAWSIFAINVVLAYSFGWDAFAYHLPVAVSWLQQESLRIPASGAWKFSLPANEEIGAMLLLAAGWQRLAAVFNWLAFGISALAVYILALKVAAHRSAAVISVVLYSIVPIVQFQANSAYVDLYGTAFLLAALAVFACRHDGLAHERRSVAYLATLTLAGLSLGIAIGTKPTFYPYAAILAVGIAAVAWSERRQIGFSPLLVVAALGVSILIPSYFWFLRAGIATGNPIYPIPVALFGQTIFPGAVLETITNEKADMQFLPTRSRLEWLTYPWVEFKHTGYSYSLDSGFGAAWAAFVPLGLALGVPLAVRGVTDMRWRSYALLFLVFTVFALVWWFGLRKLLRFSIPWVALACVLTAPMFALLVREKSKTFQALLVATVATTSVFSALLPAQSILGLIRSKAWDRASILEYPEIVDSLPHGSTVWNVARSTWNFALLGKNLSTRIIDEPWPGIEAAAAFIAAHRVDFVMEQDPLCCESLAALGAELVFDGKAGPTHRWRVWRIAPFSNR